MSRPRREPLIPDELLEPRGDGAVLYQETDDPSAHRNTGHDYDFMLEDEDDGTHDPEDE